MVCTTRRDTLTVTAKSVQPEGRAALQTPLQNLCSSSTPGTRKRTYSSLISLFTPGSRTQSTARRYIPLRRRPAMSLKPCSCSLVRISALMFTFPLSARVESFPQYKSRGFHMAGVSYGVHLFGRKVPREVTQAVHHRDGTFLYSHPQYTTRINSSPNKALRQSISHPPSLVLLLISKSPKTKLISIGNGNTDMSALRQGSYELACTSATVTPVLSIE